MNSLWLDCLCALAFALWYEALSWPLRVVWPSGATPPEVRRVLSRLAGPLTLSLPIWLLGHVGGGGVVLTREVGWVWLGLALTAVVVVGRCRRGERCRSEFHHGEPGRGVAPRRPAKFFRSVDGLTLLMFMGCVALRRWTPEMTFDVGASGAEKFPNAMMWWASWHARALPPEDYWLAGRRLAYYYFAHWHWAWVGRVGGFGGEWALTLALARATTAVFEAAWLLARAMGLRGVWATGAALATAWAGNPAAVVEAWRVLASPALGWTSYDFWRPSRALGERVVDEFPAFSAVLGDFHAHHLALAWWTAWLAVLVAGRRWWRSLQGRAPLWAAWWALGSAAVAANLWNAPLMGAALGVAALAVCFGRVRSHPLHLGAPPREMWFAFLVQIVLVALAVALTRGGAAWPLPPGEGNGLWAHWPVAVLPSALRSTPGGLFAMWGLPVAVLAWAVVARVVVARGGAFALASATLVCVCAPVLMPGWPGGVGWVWVGVALGGGALALGRRPWLAPRVFWPFAAACGVLAALEWGYVRDRFTGDLVRYNTYFKFSYPVWPILTVVAGVAARRVWRSPGRGRRWVGRGVLLAALAAGCVYTPAAFVARLGQAVRGDAVARRPTLNAFDFLQHRAGWRAEADALEWIRRHVPPGEVVLEAASARSAYDAHGRVASLGGHPTPLGWAHHEQQWRGAAAYGAIERRAEAVRCVYTAPDAERLRAAARRLDARWVLYGTMEAVQYGPAARERLLEAGRVAGAWPEDAPRCFVFDLGERASDGAEMNCDR